MLLGDLLSRFADETVAMDAILRLDDVALLAALRARADAEGLQLGDFAAIAVQRYAAEASDEEWVTLLGVMERSTDPGLTYLNRAFVHVTRAY